MAAIAVPALEALAVRVLAAMGVAIAGEATREIIAKRQEDSEDAKSSPAAKSEKQTKEKKSCDECPPDCGAPFARSTAGWSETSIEYQARIGGMPVTPGFITEWLVNGVTFDGFDSSACLLKEAKARYDQFFDDFGRVRKFWKDGPPGIIAEVSRQGMAAVPRPPVQLHWYFMEPMSFRFFQKIIVAMYPDIQVVYMP